MDRRGRPWRSRVLSQCPRLAPPPRPAGRGGRRPVAGPLPAPVAGHQRSLLDQLLASLRGRNLTFVAEPGAASLPMSAVAEPLRALLDWACATAAVSLEEDKIGVAGHKAKIDRLAHVSDEDLAAAYGREMSSASRAPCSSKPRRRPRSATSARRSRRRWPFLAGCGHVRRRQP